MCPAEQVPLVLEFVEPFILITVIPITVVFVSVYFFFCRTFK